MNITKPQKMIYNMIKVDGDCVAINCSSLLIDGEKSISEIQSAVNGLFYYNDIFRVSFFEENGEIKQHFCDFSYREFEVLRFENKAELDVYAENYVKEPLILTESVCDFKIVILENQYGLLVKLHHIISDAWTFGLLATQFNALLNKTEIEAFSYADYLETEKKYLVSNRYVKDKSFFLNQVKKCSSPIYLSDRIAISLEANRKVFIIEKNDAKKIFTKAQKKGCSVLSLFSLAFAIYISRVKMNVDNFFIGTTILNRNGKKELNTAGIFVNTVPMLFKLDGSKTFEDNLNTTEDALMSLFRHQKYSYSDLLEHLNKENASQKKLYDVMINYMNAAVEAEDTSNQTTWYYNNYQNETLKINIDDRDREGIFKIHYDYQTEKFTEIEIEKLHDHLCNLLFDAIENPDKKISELEMISVEEKNKILYDLNNTSHIYNIPENSTLYSLFEKTANENKDKICIKTAQKVLTFGELLNISGRLDSAIRNITKGDKSVIALIAERSVEMYSAIYGIIRGGNAYLPIDPEYPQERIEYILRNSKATVAVVQSKYLSLTADLSSINMTELISSESGNSNILPSAALEDDTAYVIYTSGSTGAPKGVKISHKSAVNRILWMHDMYPLDSDDVILQKTPYTFDVSVWEHFWWGICGGSLAVSEPGEHFLPSKILDSVYRNKVTHLHFVPSVFELFLNYIESNEEEQNKFDSVKYVFLSGESLSSNLIDRFYKLYDCSKVTLHNLYGPTECAIDVTYYNCSFTDADPVPIGKPIYNTQIYIMDKNMELVPMGVKGQLCVAGVNVGQGYLGNPELTAEKFIDNPFGEGKFYKTGDLAYQREDGNIIFCGRIDSQIKLNGQRIELGEIESVVGSIDNVDSVAVIVKKISSKDMLIAFYTGENISDETIRSFCSKKLPKYMVPGAFIHLDKLPLNQSGKLDRNALASIEIKIPDKKIQSPINHIERYICKTFEKTLNKENIGRNSDFFELDGTSLSMISILSEKGFENISASDFMRNPTPAALAKLMSGNKSFQHEYLEPLYISDKPEQVMIVLPFAGGSAEGYSNFVKTIKKLAPGISLYYVRYIYSFDELKKVAAEIGCAFENMKISIYSHCVGSAIALQLIKVLESKNISVMCFYAGASIPPKKTYRNNIWNKIPDIMLKKILIYSGAQLNSFSDEYLNEMFIKFRKDTDFAGICFADSETKIKTPVSVILSKSDIFTKNYKSAERCWSKYAENVVSVNFIDSKSHYFQSDDCEKLVKLILSTR